MASSDFCSDRFIDVHYNAASFETKCLSTVYLLFLAGTLPRAKKRVRKVTADPISATSLLLSPPTSRMSRSMSSPVDPGQLNFSVTSEFGESSSLFDPSHNPLLSSNVHGATNTGDIAGSDCRHNNNNGLASPDENANVCKDKKSINRQLSIPIVTVTDTDLLDTDVKFQEELSSLQILQKRKDPEPEDNGLHVLCGDCMSMVSD